MTFANEKKGGFRKQHPYLHGNFAPIHRIQPLTACTYTGIIPKELAGGEYVRNGGNPVTNGDLGRDAHWFDGDGMLSGVAFRREKDGGIHPHFVNQYILTDAYLSSISTPSLRAPILPSIATLVNPASTLLTIILRIFRTIFLVILSNLPGSAKAITKISVANTSVLYHDGRALATCESGPPMRISLPGLETVGWYNGVQAEGEPVTELEPGEVFGGSGLIGFMKEWTTAHPRIDPITNELILFHSTFVAPFVHYSIIPSTQHNFSPNKSPRLVNAAVPGVKSAKMMHDFGVSLSHTIIMDLPLSLDPLNLVRNEPVVSYDPAGRSRFGVFSRWKPEDTRWFETNACCIFHTANTWDETVYNTFTKEDETISVNMLACRLTSASLVFSAGDVAAPIPKANPITNPVEEEQCRLYYYRFSFTQAGNFISHQFALSSIPFEFPSLRDSVAMSEAQYIYGCSVSDSTFGAALGRAVKIDSLVRVDVLALISRGKETNQIPIIGCVDRRTVAEVLASDDPCDPIKIFKLPEGFYAQESRFVPRENGKTEDDGWLLSYVFDEAQLDEYGVAGSQAKSELWVIDARDMKTIVCKIQLPQRVPYGLHGAWFGEKEIEDQRPVESIRHLPLEREKAVGEGIWMHSWMMVRKWLLEKLG
ncbi:8da229c1-03d7-4c3d-b508-b01580c32381 [Sclerotinia trifoliorum]|uniref:8da229c1-03d7-4c3d-b508-b01580c32381 n=1 Tax=Sclerotinia trifoliorum TaxID=28548 RepID=A0A8H2W130_9HELO|nr:8da229c1-03d7-4c3d-b508-b01580c32381 [Sclerotinia trifoliorum]